MSSIPALGTIGCTPTFGPWYDRIVARGIQWTTATRNAYSKSFHDAKVNHAVVYVGDVVGYDKPQLVQGQPGGASFADWDSYGEHMIWLHDIHAAIAPETEPITNVQFNPIIITKDQRQGIVTIAKDCAVKKIGYNYLDFVAIALAQQRLGNTISYSNPPWWVKRLSNPRRMICSQLVDYAYSQAGIKLFDDGRPAGLVSPGDLYSLAQQND